MSLRSNAIRNKTLDEAEAAVRDLSFLPMCTPPPGSTTRTPALRTRAGPEPSTAIPAPAGVPPPPARHAPTCPARPRLPASVPEQNRRQRQQGLPGTV